MAYPSNSDGVAQDQLRAFVERIERLDEEIKALNGDKTEVYAEARGNGFDVKVLRKIIGDRRKDSSDRLEFEALYDLYAAALGMQRGGAEDRPAVGTPVATRARTKPATTAAASERSAAPQAASLATIQPSESTATPLQEASEAIGAHNADRPGSTPGPATQSTAARTDVLGTEGKGGVSPPPDRTLAELGVAPPAGDQAEPGAGAAAPPVDSNVPEPLRHASRSEPTDIAGKERPESASTNSQTREGMPGERPGTPDAAAEPSDLNASDPQRSVGATREDARAEGSVTSRPDGCLNPSVCASSSWRKLCHGCAKSSLAPVGLTIGAADIPHQGAVS